MTSTDANTSQPPAMTSFERVSHIPVVECGLSRLHATLSTTPLIRTAYTLSLSVSSRVMPYVSSASAHYPFAPVLYYGDAAANKTLDIAEQTWPYPFQSKPEKVWNDVRSVADSRVVQPAFGVAKSVDQHLAPLVNSFSFVVKKIDADADQKARPSPDDYQVQRAYALLRVLGDDILRTANDDQNAVMKNIHAILTQLTEHSAALRSRSEGAASRVQGVAQAVLSELDKLAPLLSSLTSNTSTTLKNTAVNLRTILTSEDPVGQKIPKLGAAVQVGVRDVVEDVVDKVHGVVNDILSSSGSSSSSSSPTSSNNDSADSKSGSKRNKRKKNDAQSNGSPHKIAQDS